MRKFINTGAFQCSYDEQFFLAEKNDGFIKLLIEDAEYIVESKNVSIEEADEIISILKQNMDIILSNSKTVV